MSDYSAQVLSLLGIESLSDKCFSNGVESDPNTKCREMAPQNIILSSFRTCSREQLGPVEHYR
jgi:hypothetical protein